MKVREAFVRYATAVLADVEGVREITVDTEEVSWRSPFDELSAFKMLITVTRGAVEDAAVGGGAEGDGQVS